MLKRIIALFKPSPDDLRQRFLARYTGCTLIVHEGLTIGWVSELLKEAGGAGHFRFDVRQFDPHKPSPIEWVVHAYIKPLAMPLPALIKIEKDVLFLRHLTRNGKPVHPSEINWMLGEFPRKVHYILRLSTDGFVAEQGMPISENAVDYEAGLAELD